MAKAPAVFFYQKAISESARTKVFPRELTFSKSTTPTQIAEWEEKMRLEVGLNVRAGDVVGIMSISGCGGVGGGNDDCDNWT
ncbi:hypothetical protein [Rhizobiales bacterium 3FA27D7]|jgi:hypothetical protein|uniref:hypothetical protein n=1 Tax=Mesorhizobium sp. 2RAF21 TaxID=3232995 RepID=UPI0010F9EDCC